MKILITGGAGYIGSHVAKHILKETDFNLTIIDNLSTGFIETIETLKTIRAFEFVNLDLSDWNDLKKLFETHEFNAVIHFAASLIVPESVENPLKYYLNNTSNGTYLIKCCIDHNVNYFIFSSTAAVYGEPKLTTNDKIKETHPTNPINPYGQSKLFIEKILKDTAKAHNGFKYVALRYFNVAGADKGGLIGQSTKNATHLIKVAAQTALGKRDKMYIFGDDYPTPDGTCIRDYIDVDDLALAHIKALKYIPKNESGVFNCGYGKGFSVKEVIQTMKEVSGNDFEVEITDRRKGDPAILVADNTKIVNSMGWSPKYNNLKLICKTALEWERKIK
ncbi:UDP-glucose 4-epimerase GalE [Hippea maritima]|uniref:UDP-glucose 4-epimerase n=1 Tax=Hippea maritima (strain ATCC 700847 / DSM 10411 / MH2) TaxID=760142 RepID=F2LUZ1_HIPMA|nr:UDP-glucose 4-epimerase GalE [Hippea maritima]AEA34660.1 UDP-glucose 4-epimerase [Hippea maritima DSM 10411]